MGIDIVVHFLGVVWKQTTLDRYPSNKMIVQLSTEWRIEDIDSSISFPSSLSQSTDISYQQIKT